MSQVHNPKHDPAGYRVVPNTSRELNQDRVKELLAKEWELFKKTTNLSGKENIRASKALPLGVTSSFQHWDPYPISIASAKGAYVKDVDGRKLLDLSMGFGAMMVGHLIQRWFDSKACSEQHRNLVCNPFANCDRRGRIVQKAFQPRHDSLYQLRHRVADVCDSHCQGRYRQEGNHQVGGWLPRWL